MKQVLALVLLAPLSATAAELTLTVDGYRPGQGSLVVGVYDTPASFDRAVQLASETFRNDPERVAGVALRATCGPPCRVALAGLPPGRYAVIAFHDRNGNGRLDKNFIGKPTEPYVFSNNASNGFAAPHFAQAAFDLGAEDLTLTLHLGPARLPQPPGAEGREPAESSRR